MQCPYGFSALSEECKNHKKDKSCEPCCKMMLEIQLQAMAAKIISDMSTEEREKLEKYIAEREPKEG